MEGSDVACDVDIRPEEHGDVAADEANIDACAENGEATTDISQSDDRLNDAVFAPSDALANDSDISNITEQSQTIGDQTDGSTTLDEPASVAREDSTSEGDKTATPSHDIKGKPSSQVSKEKRPINAQAAAGDRKTTTKTTAKTKSVGASQNKASNDIAAKLKATKSPGKITTTTKPTRPKTESTKESKTVLEKSKSAVKSSSKTTTGAVKTTAAKASATTAAAKASVKKATATALDKKPKATSSTKTTPAKTTTGKSATDAMKVTTPSRTTAKPTTKTPSAKPKVAATKTTTPAGKPVTAKPKTSTETIAVTTKSSETTATTDRPANCVADEEDGKKAKDDGDRKKPDAEANKTGQKKTSGIRPTTAPTLSVKKPSIGRAKSAETTQKTPEKPKDVKKPLKAAATTTKTDLKKSTTVKSSPTGVAIAKKKAPATTTATTGTAAKKSTVAESAAKKITKTPTKKPDATAKTPGVKASTAKRPTSSVKTPSKDTSKAGKAKTPVKGKASEKAKTEQKESSDEKVSPVVVIPTVASFSVDYEGGEVTGQTVKENDDRMMVKEPEKTDDVTTEGSDVNQDISTREPSNAEQEERLVVISGGEAASTKAEAMDQVIYSEAVAMYESTATEVRETTLVAESRDILDQQFDPGYSGTEADSARTAVDDSEDGDRGLHQEEADTCTMSDEGIVDTQRETSFDREEDEQHRDQDIGDEELGTSNDSLLQGDTDGGERRDSPTEASLEVTATEVGDEEAMPPAAEMSEQHMDTAEVTVTELEDEVAMPSAAEESEQHMDTAEATVTEVEEEEAMLPAAEVSEQHIDTVEVTVKEVEDEEAVQSAAEVSEQDIDVLASEALNDHQVSYDATDNDQDIIATEDNDDVIQYQHATVDGSEAKDEDTGACTNDDAQPDVADLLDFTVTETVVVREDVSETAELEDNTGRDGEETQHEGEDEPATEDDGMMREVVEEVARGVSDGAEVEQDEEESTDERAHEEKENHESAEQLMDPLESEECSQRYTPESEAETDEANIHTEDTSIAEQSGGLIGSEDGAEILREDGETGADDGEQEQLIDEVETLEDHGMSEHKEDQMTCDDDVNGDDQVTSDDHVTGDDHVTSDDHVIGDDHVTSDDQVTGDDHATGDEKLIEDVAGADVLETADDKDNSDADTEGEGDEGSNDVFTHHEAGESQEQNDTAEEKEDNPYLSHSEDELEHIETAVEGERNNEEEDDGLRPNSVAAGFNSSGNHYSELMPSGLDSSTVAETESDEQCIPTDVHSSSGENIGEGDEDTPLENVESSDSNAREDPFGDDKHEEELTVEEQDRDIDVEVAAMTLEGTQGEPDEGGTQGGQEGSQDETTTNNNEDECVSQQSQAEESRQEREEEEEEGKDVSYCCSQDGEGGEVECASEYDQQQCDPSSKYRAPPLGGEERSMSLDVEYNDEEHVAIGTPSPASEDGVRFGDVNEGGNDDESDSRTSKNEEYDDDRSDNEQGDTERVYNDEGSEHETVQHSVVTNATLETGQCKTSCEMWNESVEQSHSDEDASSDCDSQSGIERHQTAEEMEYSCTHAYNDDDNRPTSPEPHSTPCMSEGDASPQRHVTTPVHDTASFQFQAY